MLQILLLFTNKRNLTREKHNWVYSKNIEVRQVFFKASSSELAVKQVIVCKYLTMKMQYFV